MEPSEQNSLTKYDLLANICHEGNSKEGFYRLHVLNKATGKFFNIQDLALSEIMPQEVAVSESYVQIYERRN